MPELPEVETVRRDLESSVVDKSILSVETFTSTLWKNTPEQEWKGLIGDRITTIDRRGKLLIFHLSHGKFFLAHLKMTGQFLVQKSGKIEAGIFPLLSTSTSGGMKTVGRFREKQAAEGFDQHTHVIFTLEDGSKLAFRDVRKFGYLQLVDELQLTKILSRMGIDPLKEDYTYKNFASAFVGRSKSLKAVLMDQQLIAGIGNIYADEICHRVGVRPQRSVSRLRQQQVKSLYEVSQEIIQSAVHLKGTTIRDYRRSDGSKGDYAFELKVYGRENEPCHICGGLITKIVHLGRGTHFCPKCQR